MPRARPVVEPIGHVEPPQLQLAPQTEAAPAAQPVDAHDQTDLVPGPLWSSAGLRPELSRRRLSPGWWIALASAGAFFLASAALWAS